MPKRSPSQNMSDSDVERWVTDELRWDPTLDSNAIAVSANDGEVTLRGTVGSFREKRDAEKTAQRVYGVRRVTSPPPGRPRRQRR
jgi:osmotically-inducible protein OsmY